MKPVYGQFHDAIEEKGGTSEVIIIGSNDAAESSHWRIPENALRVIRYDALAEENDERRQAVVHSHAGILPFFRIETEAGPPSAWIKGISSLRPERNAQNFRSGSEEERVYIADHQSYSSQVLSPVLTLGSRCCPKFFILDLEGLDYDIAIRLLRSPDVLGVGCEHALMTSDEIILLRCAAIESGFRFAFGEEDAIFLRQSSAGKGDDEMP